MPQIKAFIAGFVSTLAFHQGLLWLLFIGGVSPRAPYNFEPALQFTNILVRTAAGMTPLSIPIVASLAFWGGVWGIVLWWVIRASHGASYWTQAVVLGALGPSLVAWFVVMPMKGMGFAGGWDPKIIVGALMLNAAWGLGVALIMRLMNRAR